MRRTLARLGLTAVLVLGAGLAQAQDAGPPSEHARGAADARGALDLGPAGGEPDAGDAPPALSEPDSDGDGLSDALERRMGTSALAADSDGDGVPDGEEDRDHDGEVDEGESDPRRAGLFPGSSPYIPEPLNFDLVRGLGARRGEFESNVLVNVRPRAGTWGATSWAPEVEWAFIDNLAVEFELPFVDRTLEALKLAAQWTAPSPSPAMSHGVQAIVEYLIDDRATELTALYLVGGRAGRFSALAMVGGRVAVGEVDLQKLLVNPSAFVDLGETLTTGVEVNVAWSPQLSWQGLALGQLHWQITRHVRVQVGAGVEWLSGKVGALVATRVIME